MVVIKFTTTTRAGRLPREKKLKEESEARDAGQCMESKRLKGDYEEENREEG